jgi:protein-tyrosine-phosphatase
MTDRALNVLFLCTGNSARSILAEAILNHVGSPHVRGYSAGSHPKGAVHPLALDLLREMNMSTEGLRSKSWEEFAAGGAPRMDLVVTVCDAAAGEACPIWPGRPMTAHWGLPDPAAVQGSDVERRLVFRQAFASLEQHIRSFLRVTFDPDDRMSLQKQLDAIGRPSTGSAT